jgi:hypothetical protein
MREEQNFIKESLVTVLVGKNERSRNIFKYPEITKREWPQQWINLLPTLVEATKKGVCPERNHLC